MSNITFEWDQNKARTNAKKHGISFEEARSVFLDENARLIADPDHSTTEDRFLLLGYSFMRGVWLSATVIEDRLP